MNPNLNPRWLVLRARRVGTAVIILILLGVLIVVALNSTYGFAGRGGAITPIVRLIPVLLGTVVGISSSSAQPDVEKLAGSRLEVTVLIILLILTLFAALVAAMGAYVGGLIVDAHPATVADLATAQLAQGGGIEGYSEGSSSISYIGEVALILMRGTIAYCGVSMLSAASFGHYYAWVLPVLTIPAVTLMGFDNLGVPYSWNVLSTALLEPTTWLVAVGAVLIGLVAITVSIARGPFFLIQHGS